MLGVILAALAVPAPSPTPLKTISHIHASPFCTAMRENVGHAVGALLANKVVIGDGKSTLQQMARDLAYRASPGLVIDVDMVKVDRTIGAMVKNLAQTDAALNDLKHIPQDPKTDDDRHLAQMRDQLRAIADTQRRALDVFSGMYESYGSNELLAKGNPLTGMIDAATRGAKAAAAAGTEDAGTPVVIPPITSAGATTVPDPAPTAAPTPVPEVYEGIAGATPFAHLFNAVTTVQLQEEALEVPAAQTILKYSQTCK